MASFILPSGDPENPTNTDILRTVDLEGVSYDVRLRWNTRDQSWTMNLIGPDNVEIFYTKITTNRILNRFYKHRPNCPQGELLVIDGARQGERISLLELSPTGRFKLVYLESNGIL